ncbi:MAG: GNAT family N-acetyltransferase [Chloroflexota bacterium]
MKITDCSFTNNDTEYTLIKELLLEVESYPDIDNNWEPGRMDWWRYNYHAEKGVDFFQANAHYWKTETDQIVGLFILRSLQSSPSYQAELDLVIVNPEGESVAYCMGWIEENDPKSGYIEPMGVHTDYRRNGLGTALAKACFKRLGNRGVERVWIASNAEPDVSNFLYDSLHPTSIKQSYKYSLNLD